MGAQAPWEVASWGGWAAFRVFLGLRSSEWYNRLTTAEFSMAKVFLAATAEFMAFFCPARAGGGGKGLGLGFFAQNSPPI